jgi:hypothetical protein
MTADAPSTALIVGTLFLGLVAAMFWPITTHALTIAHEGSHAILGSAAGGRITSVTMSVRGDGETKVQYQNALTFIVSALFGYLGPSLFGILGAVLLVNGLAPHLVLWVSLGLLLVILLQIRNLFGAVAVVVAGFFFYLVAHYGTPTGRTVFAYTWVWFLLLGGFFDVLVLQGVRRDLKSQGHKDAGHDAAHLRDKTKLPAALWVGFWWLATLAALIYGAGILFGVVDVVPGSV